MKYFLLVLDFIANSIISLLSAGPKIVDANKCQEFTLSVNESIVETIHIRNIPKKSSLKVINAEEIIIYGSHVKVPNWITAEFLVTTPNATYFLNNYENIFLTILSRSNQGAPYKLAVDVAVHSSLSEYCEITIALQTSYSYHKHKTLFFCYPSSMDTERSSA